MTIRNREFPEKNKRVIVARFDNEPGTILDQDDDLFKVRLDNGELCWNKRYHMVFTGEST